MQDAGGSFASAALVVAGAEQTVEADCRKTFVAQALEDERQGFYENVAVGRRVAVEAVVQQEDRAGFGDGVGILNYLHGEGRRGEGWLRVRRRPATFATSGACPARAGG